jgi:tetratricopeptide (TPR) repeat protein
MGFEIHAAVLCAFRSNRFGAQDLRRRHTNRRRVTPAAAEYMAQAKAFFARALKLDAGQVESPVAIAAVDSSVAANFMVDDRNALLAAAVATVTKALSISPQHARGHLVLGSVLIVTKRAAQGVRECELSLALDQNSADAHGLIGLAKIFLGRGAETEAHIQEAFRLSPRDIFAFRWLHYVAMARQTLGDDAGAAAWLLRSPEANRTTRWRICADRVAGGSAGRSTGGACAQSGFYTSSHARPNERRSDLSRGRQAHL